MQLEFAGGLVIIREPFVMGCARQIGLDVETAIRSAGDIGVYSIRRIDPPRALLPHAVIGIGRHRVNPRECRDHQAVFDFVGSQRLIMRKDQGGNTARCCGGLGSACHREIGCRYPVCLVVLRQIAPRHHARNHVRSRCNQVGFDEPIQCRPGRRERSDVVVVPVQRGVIIGECAHGYNIGIVPRNADGHR